MIECSPGSTWTPGQRPLTPWLPARQQSSWLPDRADDAPAKKRRLKQYFSGASLARMMASMMDYSRDEMRLLDPGAGEGALLTACVERACETREGGGRRRIHVTAYEIDPDLWGALDAALGRASDTCSSNGIQFSHTLARGDFLRAGASGVEPGGFTHVIANPPYGKLGVSTATHRVLRQAGIHTTNTYAAFIAVSQHMLVDGGQMVFISPRSFCNGTYFDGFRTAFLDTMALRRVHLFGSRTIPFSGDGVLQETVVVCAQKGGRRRPVAVSVSLGPEDACRPRRVTYSEVVHGGDPRRIIHIIPDEAGARVSAAMRGMECTLDDIGLQASTGRVIDFRARDELRHGFEEGAVPLVRPFHITNGVVSFPAENGRKHDRIMYNEATKNLLVENGNYVLVKRMSSVEERRRVVAAVWKGYSSGRVGFENMLNYFHKDGGGLGIDVARGLCTYLNSAMVDAYFRQFSGNTHVNAADLRYLRYPTLDTLKRLGRV